MKPMKIRPACASDQAAILEVSMAAFGQEHGPEVTELITNLLADPTAQPVVSLLALAEEKVIGHILFTQAQVQGAPRAVAVSLLSPLSVHPEFQNQGVGGELIRAGMAELKTLGVELVFVLGHPGYYPRYGFAPAGLQGFTTPYPIKTEQADAWMVQELQAGALDELSGQVTSAAALNDPKYWQE